MLIIDRTTHPVGTVFPRRGVFYSCTALFPEGSEERSQVFDWNLLPTAADAFKQIRRAAVGVTQVLDEYANADLRSWLRDREALTAFDSTLETGGTYELELCGAATRMVLAARWVTVLPLADRPQSTCPALMLRGRRLWAERRDGPAAVPRSMAVGPVAQDTFDGQSGP